MALELVQYESKVGGQNVAVVFGVKLFERLQRMFLMVVL